jgi:hypothetical protein
MNFLHKKGHKTIKTEENHQIERISEGKPKKNKKHPNKKKLE